jgi:mannosyltransferase
MARRTSLMLAGLIGAALILRVIGLARPSLWIDEAYMYWYSAQSLHALWQVFPDHYTLPPLFATMLKGWRWLFGDGEAALRSLSVTASVLTVPVVYVLGRVAAGPEQGERTGLIAALLFAIAPLHVDYAQQAYVYTWLTLGVGVALAGALWLVVDRDSARQRWLGLAAAGAARWAWLAVIAGCALALWMHNTAVVFVAALGIMALWLGWRERRPAAYYVNLVLAGAGVLVLWSPFAAHFLAQVGVVSRNFWVEEVDLASALQFVPFLFEVRFAWPIKLAVVLVPLAAFGLFALARWNGRRVAQLLLGVAGLAYGLLLLFSLLVNAILVDRLLIWVSLPFYVAVAAGLLAVSTRWLRALLAGAIVCVSLFGYANYLSWFEREPWRDMAALIAAHAGPDDVVVNLPNSNVIALDYYLERLGSPVRLVGLPVPFPSFDSTRPAPAGVVFTPAFEASDVALLDRATRGAAAVWYVARVDEVFDPEGIALAHLRATRRQTDHWPVRKHIDLYRFE